MREVRSSELLHVSCVPPLASEYPHASLPMVLQSMARSESPATSRLSKTNYANRLAGYILLAAGLGSAANPLRSAALGSSSKLVTVALEHRHPSAPTTYLRRPTGGFFGCARLRMYSDSLPVVTLQFLLE